MRLIICVLAGSGQIDKLGDLEIINDDFGLAVISDD
jgi:hypothetical protein